MPEKTYYQIVQTLNKKQRAFFYHVLHHFKTSDKPIYNFLYQNKINPSSTPIFEAKRKIPIVRNGSFTVIRSQFPLRPAAAKNCT